MCIRDRHRELIKFKNYRRSLIEILEGNCNKVGSKNLNKAISKLNIPAIKMYHIRSVISLINNIPLTDWFSKPDDKMIEVGSVTILCLKNCNAR